MVVLVSNWDAASLIPVPKRFQVDWIGGAGGETATASVRFRKVPEVAAFSPGDPVLCVKATSDPFQSFRQFLRLSEILRVAVHDVPLSIIKAGCLFRALKFTASFPVNSSARPDPLSSRRFITTPFAARRRP